MCADVTVGSQRQAYAHKYVHAWHDCVPLMARVHACMQEAAEKLEGQAASAQPKWQPLQKPASLAMLLGVLGMLGLFVFHCIHASSDMYSQPSIVLVTQQK